MRNLLFLVLLIGVGAACEPPLEPASISYFPFVDPFIGTAPSTTPSALRHSEAQSELRGQVVPTAGVPFGMTQWTPQTRASEQKCIA
ncbi:MAG: hypothetical protein AAFP92_33235, partial [Bacteroidota bacterium]